MGGKRDEDTDERARQIEHEIREHHHFTLADVIGSEAGGFFEGVSPIPRNESARLEVRQFVARYDEIVAEVIATDLDATALAAHLDDPLGAVEIRVRHVLCSEASLYEFVRRVDVTYGRVMDERPYFERPGQPPHPDDAYTIASVRELLTAMLDALSERNRRG